MENQTPNLQTPPPNPVSPPQPTIQTPLSNKPKGKIRKPAILGVIVFLILAMAGFAFKDQVMKMVSKPTPTPAPVVKPSPTPDPTAEWKTYQNIKYGFSFKYDKSFTLLEKETKYGILKNTEQVNLKNFTDKTQLTDPKATSIIVSYRNVTENIDELESWLDKEKIDYSTITGVPATTIRNVIKSKIMELDAIEFEAGAENTDKNVLFKKGNTLVMFTLLQTGETGSSYKDLPAAVKNFDQILSTFKFTN